MMAASDKNECVKCKNTIKDTEVVVVCGLWCSKTFHNECLGLSKREARAVMCSRVRVKFHCEACEKRLANELVGRKEAQESKNLGNGVSLLELLQKLVKLTNELSSDNSTINSKLDTVISSNTRLEEYLLQSSKRFEKQNEETFDNAAGNARNRCIKIMTGICDPNSYANSHERRKNSERMCIESEFQRTNDNLQRIANEQQHEETFDNGVGYVASYSAKRITEICARNSDKNSHDQIMNSESMCRESQFQHTEDNLHRIESDVPEQVADGQHQNFTESYSSDCVQQWGVPEGHKSTHDPLSVDEECMQQWKEPDGQDSTQGAPTFVKEEYSPPEDFLTSGAFSIQKTENAEVVEKSVTEVEGEEYSSSEDFLQPCTLSTEKTINEDEIVNENNFEELKHEMESTITSGEAESCTPTSVEADKINEDSSGLVTTFFLAAPTGHGKQHPYNCSICKKTFTRKFNMQGHMRLHTGERPYSCSICNKTFPQKRQLMLHIRVHTGERPYNCNICNKKYIQKSDLRKHFLVHTGERPYSCSSCNKTFSQKRLLLLHFRVHTGERPYSCNICNKTFSNSSNLNKHIRVHTAVC